MAIKILNKNNPTTFFTIEDSSTFFNKGSKGINSKPGLGDVNRAHIQGFAEKHVQAALENIVRTNDSGVSGNQQDGFILDESLYKKLQEFYNLENQDENFEKSMKELDQLEGVITAAKEHSENSSKALDTFKASVIQTLLTSENVEGVKTGLDAAAEKLKQNLEYNNPKWYIQLKGWIGQTLENFAKAFVNGCKWLFNKLGLFTTTDLEKRQAALEIDYRAFLGQQTNDPLDKAQQASLDLCKGIMAEFDGQRLNKDTLVTEDEVKTYLTKMTAKDDNLSEAIGDQNKLAKLIVNAYTARDLNQESARNALARRNHQPEYLKDATYVNDRHEKHQKAFQKMYDDTLKHEEKLELSIQEVDNLERPGNLNKLLEACEKNKATLYPKQYNDDQYDYNNSYVQLNLLEDNNKELKNLLQFITNNTLVKHLGGEAKIDGESIQVSFPKCVVDAYDSDLSGVDKVVEGLRKDLERFNSYELIAGKIRKAVGEKTEEYAKSVTENFQAALSDETKFNNVLDHGEIRAQQTEYDNNMFRNMSFVNLDNSFESDK